MIAGRTPAEASRSYRDALQRTLSCVTPNILVPLRNTTTSAPAFHDLILSNSSASLSGTARVSLDVQCRFSLVATTAGRSLWQARTAAYFYTISEIDGREIVAYHWHPAGRSHETEPHLHLEAGAGIGRRELLGAHLPTGQIELPDVVRFVIQHFVVRPLRPDWSAVLEDARAALT